MILRLALAGTVVAAIFVMSPVRQDGDVVRGIVSLPDNVIGTVLATAAPLATAAGPLLSGPTARFALQSVLTRSGHEAHAAGAAPAVALKRAAVDTLRPLDRQPPWRGPSEG